MEKRFVTLGVAATLALAALGCTPTPPPAGPAIPTCFDGTVAGSPDGQYTAFNQLGNITLWTSTDGSCTGSSLPGANTVVIAATEAEAIAICAGLNPAFDSVTQPTVGTLTPEPGPDFWTCDTAIPS